MKNAPAVGPGRGEDRSRSDCSSPDTAPDSKRQRKTKQKAQFARDQGAALLNDVHDFLGRFVAYPSDHAHVAHALWIVHAHLMEAWVSTPRIAFLSPEPASGKTRALEVSALLVPRPVEAINVTPAYLFRKVASQDGLPTILYDEIDTVFGPKAKGNEDVRALLNAGHRKGAVAGRCVVRGKTVLTEEIPAYCAVALAGLGWLPDTILSRSIIIRMRRRAPNEPIQPFRPRVHEKEGELLCDRLAAWGAAASDYLADHVPDLPADITDRDADVWEALIALADYAGGSWPERSRIAAVEMVKARREREPSLGIRLLGDLRLVFGNREAMSTADILVDLIAIKEAPWGDLKGKPLDDRGLAARLRSYEIKSKQIRFGERTLKGYLRADCNEAWRRYLLPSPEKSETSETSAKGVSDVSDVSLFAANGGEAPEPSYPPVCVHCGEPQDRPDNPVQECWVDGENYLLHRNCQREWLAS
jgi:hypothetical protein